MKTKSLKLFICCGFIGPLFFIASFLLQGIFKKGYSALRYPISSLSIGEQGWVQVCTFIISGLLILLFSFGIKKQLNKKLISVLFVLVAIGLIASGIFSTDPVYGFPEDSPFINDEFTLHGKLHTLFSLLVFINIPVICFIMSKYFKAQKSMQWRFYSIATGIMMLVLFLVTGFAFRHFFGLGGVAGLIQRLCVITGFVWISLFAVYLNTLPGANDK